LATIRKDETWIWTFEDVTAHRAAEQALRQSHLELEQRVAERTLELSQQLHFMRQLIEAIPGPVFYKNRRRDCISDAIRPFSNSSAAHAAR
jgi:PAS domain-containing protein